MGEQSQAAMMLEQEVLGPSLEVLEGQRPDGRAAGSADVPGHRARPHTAPSSHAGEPGSRGRPPRHRARSARRSRQGPRTVAAGRGGWRQPRMARHRRRRSASGRSRCNPNASSPGGHWGGKGPPGPLVAPVRMAQAWADGEQASVGPEVGHQLVQAVRLEDSVRIQEQDQISPTKPRPLVGGGGEAEIPRVADDPGAIPLRHLGAAVASRRCRHNNLGSCRERLPGRRGGGWPTGRPPRPHRPSPADLLVEREMRLGDRDPGEAGRTGASTFAQLPAPLRMSSQLQQGAPERHRVAGGTSMPASPTTSGRDPEAEATTGTPLAIASTATRQNCSCHRGVGREGTARASSVAIQLGQLLVRQGGVELHLTDVGRAARASPSRSPRVGPSPTICRRHPGWPAAARSRMSTPFSGVRRPT